MAEDEAQQGGGGPQRGDTTASFQALSTEAEAAERGLSTDEMRAVDELPAGSAILLVERGPDTGARFLLDADRTTAGRHPDNDIFLDDVTVSRKHAEFVREGSRFRLRDVGSLNGTYVNRDRVDDVVLTGGDEVQIGKFRMTFHASRQVGGGDGR